MESAVKMAEKGLVSIQVGALRLLTHPRNLPLRHLRQKARNRPARPLELPFYLWSAATLAASKGAGAWAHQASVVGKANSPKGGWRRWRQYANFLVRW